MVKPPRIAPAGFPHAECHEDYMEERREHTAAMMLETNPPVEGGVESVEGVELPVVIGETPIMEREWVSQFNGA